MKEMKYAVAEHWYLEEGTGIHDEIIGCYHTKEEAQSVADGNNKHNSEKLYREFRVVKN